MDLGLITEPKEAVTAMGSAITLTACLSYITGAMTRESASGFIALGTLATGLINVMDADYLMAVLQLLASAVAGHTWWMGAFSQRPGNTDS